MYILIHRMRGKDAEFDYFYLRTLFAGNLCDRYLRDMIVYRDHLRICIRDVAIEFRYGERLYNMAGLYPNYYNTDSYEAEYYLKLTCAPKVNGKYLSTLYEVCEVVKNHLEGDRR